MTFSFDALRRFPDPEAPNLYAVDAADRLLLDTAEPALEGGVPGELVVIDDSYGALTLGAAALHGACGIRVHQDGLVAERALAANAAELGLAESFRSLLLGEELLAGARIVLLRLPKSLDALDEIAEAVARWAAEDVTVLAGGMVKHMTPAMNQVLARHFSTVQAGLGRQKARVLTATSPLLWPSEPRAAVVSGPAANPPATDNRTWPHREFHDDIGLWICAHGGAFAGTKLDIGTRFLLGFLPEAKPDAASAIDLGCGTGVLATALAVARPAIRVLATDQSAAAVASAVETASANGVGERVATLRDDALSSQPDASAELILLNPPFHIGASVHAGVALRLIEDAARVLAPGGELWTVFNTHLGYAPALRRLVGPTRIAGRNAKFTVAVSTRGDEGEVGGADRS